MTDDFALPHRLTLLGEAMVPVGRKIRTQIRQRILASAAVSDMAQIIPRHMVALQALVQKLEDRIKGLVADVLENENATDGDVYRAVGRFEALTEDWLAGYHGVRALHASGHDAQARDLLAGIYRHGLEDIRAWLEELCGTLRNPMAVARRRGLPTDGHIMLPVTLTLTPAPEMAALSRWVENHMGNARKVSTAPVAKSGLGFWGTASALILGWSIGDALFGDDCCGPQ